MVKYLVPILVFAAFFAFLVAVLLGLAGSPLGAVLNAFWISYMPLCEGTKIEVRNYVLERGCQGFSSIGAEVCESRYEYYPEGSVSPLVSNTGKQCLYEKNGLCRPAKECR